MLLYVINSVCVVFNCIDIEIIHIKNLKITFMCYDENIVIVEVTVKIYQMKLICCQW